MNRLWLGGVPIDRVTMAQALDRIEALVDARRGGSVFTPNLDHVVNAQRNPEFAAAYRSATLCIADGQPLVWASRLFDEPLPEKVSGSDLILPLAQRAAARRFRLFLLGGAPGVAQAAGDRLRAQTGVEIAGSSSPVIGLGASPADGETVAQVRASGAHLLLVALGAPKQELFIHRCAAALGAVVCLGVGGSLDFIAGVSRRAPRWMSRAGLEWLHRLAHDPRRLARRYLWDDPRFLGILVRELRRTSAQRPA